MEGLTLPTPPVAQTKEIHFLYGALADSDLPKLLWRRLYTQALMKRQDPLYYSVPGNEPAYMTPSPQFPLGAVLPIGRRREMLSWANANSSRVIADDDDCEFRYGLRAKETLQSLDADGSVIYIGTFSKALSPQVRLGS
jgi:DNA-binding transcriptional MocR family regulator